MGTETGFLFAGYFNNFAAFILAALGACAVRELGLVAIGALGHASCAEMVMCAAGGGALF